MKFTSGPTPMGNNPTVLNKTQSSASLLPIKDEFVLLEEKENSSAPFGVKKKK
jgi:hypothetical protein